MAVVAGGLSLVRFNNNVRAAISIVAQEATEEGPARGVATFIDADNFAYGIQVDGLNVQELQDRYRVIFSGEVTMTDNAAFEDNYLLAMLEGRDDQWQFTGNWDGATSSGCDRPPTLTGSFVVDVGSISITG
jgi:hypothetical protein